jgi:mono/diheme cytochrome c family protein
VPAWPRTQALVEKDAGLYQLRCEGCHGVNLRNTSGGWSFDLRKLKPDEHERFVDSVTSGKDNMRSWYDILKDDEIEAIWSYTRATSGKDNMPSWYGILKDDEIEAIWSYIRATSGKDNMPSWYDILKDDEIEAIWSYIRATVDR